MSEPMSDNHYEEKYIFPLWQKIAKRAEEKDISYRAAAHEVIPEYVKTIRYGDHDFENEVIRKFDESTKIADERWKKRMKDNVK